MYFYGNGLVSQYTEDSGTEYYHYNNIGSTMYLTKNGVKTHEFAYSTYGELTKGEYGEVRFMYNGRLGVATDDNGLYYMRARYYNSEIRRFINQDIVTGSIENSQSLNRYAYCQGNPVNYLDPFGLSPQSFGSWVGHTVLNVLSFVPVFGNVADAFNAVWYAYEGNYAEAIACAVGAIPLIGNLATGFKIGSKVVKGCNIAANGGKAAIGFYNGVQNVMNIDRMIWTGTGRWYDYLGQGIQFGLNMFVSAVGISGAWNGISNLVDELNYKKMQKLAQEVSWNDIDGGEKLTELLEQEYKEDLIHVYRGTNRYLEISAFNETGHLLSDATRNIYFETGNLDIAYEQSGVIHDSWLKIWGNENDYVQAHGAFGTELSKAFGLDRTFMSVTTDPDVARRFAGTSGRVFEAYIPKSQLIKQTLSGAGESEYLIKFGSGEFK